MRLIGRVILLALGLVLVSRAASAQELPEAITLGRGLDYWRIQPWSTERVLQNRERCRDAIAGRLMVLTRYPGRLERHGFNEAWWDLYGDDFNVFGLVHVENHRLDVWCEFASDGSFRDLHLKTRFVVHDVSEPMPQCPGSTFWNGYGCTSK
jgi:hypothetical protein